MCVDSAGRQEVVRQTAGRGLEKIGCEQRGREASPAGSVGGRQGRQEELLTHCGRPGGRAAWA